MQCKKCFKDKNLSDFYKGHKVCKKCFSEKNKENYSKNREQKILKQQEYYQKNKKDRLTYSKKYREKNREIINKKQNERYGKNREKRLEYSKKLYKENREQILITQSEYNKKNKEKISINSKKYYREHIDERREYNKNYRNKNKKKLSKDKRKYRESNIEKCLLKQAKDRAKRNGIEFNLVESDIVIPKVCPLLNIEIKSNTEYAKDNSITVDRVNSQEGYFNPNIWVISNKANRSKSSATIEDYEKIVNNLSNIINFGVKTNNINKIDIDSIFYSAKTRAKRKNLPFTINKEYLRKIYPIDRLCPLLGIELKSCKGYAQDSSPSLDRIIPNLGYIEENLIIISFRANTIKNNLTLNEMELILNNWKLKIEGKIWQ